MELAVALSALAAPQALERTAASALRSKMSSALALSKGAKARAAKKHTMFLQDVFHVNPQLTILMLAQMASRVGGIRSRILFQRLPTPF
jgi:hypothetical protein